MSSPALLLFLELNGVLVLNGSAKRVQLENAIRSVASGEAKWRDYQDLWDQLFEPEPVKQLKLLHDQFEPLYCLTSDWTALLDRPAMLNVLRLSGLGFVASLLHSRWDMGSTPAISNQATAIEAWLDTNPDHHQLWAAIDSERSDIERGNLSAPHAEFTVHCCRDAGLTSFETKKLQALLLQRIQISKLNQKGLPE
jgi:hypothetical protein